MIANAEQLQTVDQNNYRLQTLLPAVSVGLLTMAFIVAKTGRDALFFQGKGLFQLPVAYMAMGVASVPAAFLYVQAMKIWGARAARVGIIVFAAAIMAAFVPLLPQMNYAVLLSLFIFIPTIFGPMFATIWLQAAELFENVSKTVAARCFSRIGASSLGGGIVGGFVSKGLASYVEPYWLILVGSLITLAAAAVVVQTHRSFPSPSGTKKDRREGEKIGVSLAFSKKYARSLLLISMTGALAGLFIDFQFYAAASTARMGSKGNANFFANFYIMLNLGSLILQLFAAPKIQEKLGLRGGLLILPFALLGGATFVTAAATALSRSVLKVTEGGLKSSIHRSIWEQAFIPVDSSERSIVKVFVDGIGARIAEGIGASLLFVWLMRMDASDPAALNTGWIAWMLLVTAAVWLWLTQNLRADLTRESSPAPGSARERDLDCVRFPDQCPCTTEWGKGIS